MLDEVQYLSNLYRMTRLRWVASAAVLLLLCAGHFSTSLGLGFPLSISLLIPLSNVVHITLLNRRKLQLRALAIGQFLGDLLLLTALLASLGEPRGPTTALYILHVLLAALLLERRDAIRVWASAVLLAALLATLRFSALFPVPETQALYTALFHMPDVFSDSPQLIYSQVTMFTVVSTVVLLLVIPMVEESRRGRLRLEEAGHAAREQTAVLEHILENVGAMMMVLDSGHRVQWFNRAALECFPDLRIGDERHCDDTAETPPGGQEPECPTCHVLRTGKKWTGDCTVVLPTNEPRVLRVHATPLMGREGTVEKVIELLQDVTEERKTAKQLLEARKFTAITELASGVAHELNTPLASVTAGLRSFRKACNAVCSDEHIRSLLDDLDAQTERCKRITESMLGFARQVRGRLGPAEVAGIIREAIARLSNRRDLTGVDLAIHNPATETPQVCCDPEYLEMALINVLTNSVDSLRDADRPKPRILVDVTLPAGRDVVEIHITDNGLGMSPELKERAFDPFFTTKPVGKGSGFGLAVSQGFLAEMGGSIDVESEPGAGTHVVLQLQAVSAAAHRSEETLGAQVVQLRGSERR